MCIILSKEIDNKFILAKNRDRVYKPILEIIHTLIDGVEVVYLRDTNTDWSEGMNEYGIGIVNTALMVGYDELEKKIVKKRGSLSKDGNRIRRALSKKTLKEAIVSSVKYEGGIKGHTFISSPDKMVTIEMTSKHSPKIKIGNIENPLVRTNHGHTYTDAGYTEGNNYRSSIIRKLSAEKATDKIDDWRDVAPSMRKQYYKANSNLNMKRDTSKMSTSSQLVMNLTDRIFEFTYFESKVEKFKGIKTKLPSSYTPAIQIELHKI